MSSKQRAFEDLKKASAMFRGLYEAAEELAAIGSIEQAADEANARLAGLQKSESDALVRLSAVDAELMGKQAALEAVMRDTREREREQKERASEAATAAAATLKDAQDAAKQEGLRILTEARTKADGIVSAATDRAALVGAEIIDGQNRLDELNKQFAQRQAAYDDLRGKVADVMKKL